VFCCDGAFSMRVPRVATVTLALAVSWTALATPLCVAQDHAVKQAQELLAKGSVEEAIALLRRSVAEDAQNADAHLLLGSVLALEGRRGESLDELQAALRLKPNSPQFHNRMGEVLSRFVETDKARGEFETALKIDPRLADVHVNLSLVLAQQGELEAAATHLDRAIELLGNSREAARAHFLRAKIWAAQDQMEKADAELTQAVQLRPDFADAWSDLGAVRRLERNYAGAEKALVKAVELDPQNALAQYRLGQTDLENGKAEAAVRHLEIAAEYTPEDRPTLYTLMRALQKTGRDQEAESIRARVTKQLDADHRASDAGFTASELNSEGIELEKSGDLAVAVTKYKGAVDLDPTGYGFRLNYALGLCRLGQWETAAAELRTVLKADPNNADAQKALYIATDQIAQRRRSNAQ
jgi:tetratricopeptide (TPR) repeat protein